MSDSRFVPEDDLLVERLATLFGFDRLAEWTELQKLAADYEIEQ